MFIPKNKRNYKKYKYGIKLAKLSLKSCIYWEEKAENRFMHFIHPILRAQSLTNTIIFVRTLWNSIILK